MQALVRDTASKNKSILDAYEEDWDKTVNVRANKHANRLYNERTKNFSAYREAKAKYQTSKSDKDKKVMDDLFERYEDSRDTLHYALKRETDRLYEKYMKDLSKKTLKDLGSEYSEAGRSFVEDLFGDEYFKKHYE